MCITNNKFYLAFKPLTGLSVVLLFLLSPFCALAIPMEHEGEQKVGASAERGGLSGRYQQEHRARSCEEQYLALRAVGRTEERRETPEDSWDFVDLPTRKNPLSAYTRFAARHKQIISYIVINEQGETFLHSEAVPETLGGKALQYIIGNYIFVQNKFFVEDYYQTLRVNYGEEIAQKAFSRSLREEALQFGLSSELISNSLKIAAAEVLRKHLEVLNAPENVRQIRDESSENPVGGLTPQQTQQERAQLRDIATQIQQLLHNVPERPREDWSSQHPDTRSDFARYGSWLINIVDVTMTLNNSVVWARRGAFLLQLLRR